MIYKHIRILLYFAKYKIMFAQLLKRSWLENINLVRNTNCLHLSTERMYDCLFGTTLHHTNMNITFYDIVTRISLNILVFTHNF